MKGVYTLVVFMKRGIRLEVRGLGSFDVKKGYYAYTGSAVGYGALGLRRRVARHLRKDKVRHWHVDFLLASESARVVAVIAVESNVNRECHVNNAIENLEGATISIERFGATDCRQNCGSHLVHFSNCTVIERIRHTYAHLFGDRQVHVVHQGMK